MNLLQDAGRTVLKQLTKVCFTNVCVCIREKLATFELFARIPTRTISLLGFLFTAVFFVVSSVKFLEGSRARSM